MALTDVSIVILSYNRVDELRANLAYYVENLHLGYQLIVVDNNSSDGSAEYLQGIDTQYPEIQVLHNQSNEGVGKGRNLGYRTATRPYILNLDEDARLGIAEIQKLRHCFLHFPAAGILSPRTLKLATGSAQNPHGNAAKAVANYHGACHLFRREVFTAIGYLDEMCCFGGEELDFSIRARDAGFSTIYVPDVSAWHNNLSRDGTNNLWRRRQWISNFSRILFKHFPKQLAYRCFLRYTFSCLASSWQAGGTSLALSVLRAAAEGRALGLALATPVSLPTVEFYSDPQLRPDFGNVPLSHKIVLRLNDWVRTGAIYK